jgi:hypothetical protein
VYTIPGTDRQIRLRFGAPGKLLVQCAAWFHEHIEPIDAGQLDDWGYAARRIAGTNTVSNHASGTAMDLNALRHPSGVRGTFTPHQVDLIHYWLRTHDGCIRWGGDYEHSHDPMHWEIVRSPSACRKVLRR